MPVVRKIDDDGVCMIGFVLVSYSIEFDGMTVQILFEGNLGVIMKLITQGFRLRGPCGTAIGTPTHERD